MEIIQHYDIPKFELGQKYETVFIEFRNLSHIEYLVRNMIMKLPNWSHTVVCGNLNYNLIQEIQFTIGDNLKIVHLDIDNLTPSSYSDLLYTEEFWNNFIGDKLLIHQEDSIIFHHDIEPFLEYDFIGAPWPKEQDTNKNLVGNGGFSLRTKSKMLECIKKIKVENVKIGKSTKDYMINTNSTTLPEDVFFTTAMIDFKIGKVAKWDVAKEFSQETIVSKRPLGGHNFWESSSRPILNVYKLFSEDYYRQCSHRYGWKYIINSLINTEIINTEMKPKTNNNLNELLDIAEKNIVWDNSNTNYIKDWVGIIHITPIENEHTGLVPKFLDIKNFLSNDKFINMLDRCRGIVVLSNYLKKYLENVLPGNIPIKSLKHPTCLNINNLFNINRFKCKKVYKLISLGQQLRFKTTIYRIKTHHEKIWLPGIGRKKSEWANIIIKEAKTLGVFDEINFEDVLIQRLNIKQYDKIITENIIVIHLINASANNAVLEMIVTNTPFFVNKIEPVVEYLGEEYPLYFNEISEIGEIINDRNKLHSLFEQTNHYLKNIDTSDLSTDHFNSELLKFIN